MKRHVLIILILLNLVAPKAAPAQTVRISAGERKMAETISADKLSNWLHFVASDAMGGRDTPSQGLDITAEFLKMKLSQWGFKPAGDNGTFFQRMNLIIDRVDPANNTVKIGDTTFTLNSDFFQLAGNGTATGPMVFAGHGWMVKAKNIDAYEGIDVHGKIVVLYKNDFPSESTGVRLPKGVTSAELIGTRGTDWADPVTYASQNGAKGIIVIGPPWLSTTWQQVVNLFSRAGTYVQGPRKAGPTQPRALPMVTVSSAVGDAIFEGARGARDSAVSFNMSRSATINISIRREAGATQNVVALWEGSDPVLKHEMVAVGAHYDHVGTNSDAPGDDKIWNGADDDGSGTVAVLAIAEALSKSPRRPKRSVLLVWHAGEEKGLLGAQYFNKFPTVDIKNVIAQLNIDMIGRSQDPNNIIPCDPPGRRCNADLSRANEVYVSGSEMMSSALGAITKRTNDAYLKLEYNYKYDDPKDPHRFFFRSDHFHYAANNIPIAFWFTGIHEDYHQPSDHRDKIDYQKYEKITRTIFITMWKLTDVKQRPQIDRDFRPIQ